MGLAQTQLYSDPIMNQAQIPGLVLLARDQNWQSAQEKILKPATNSTRGH